MLISLPLWTVSSLFVVVLLWGYRCAFKRCDSPWLICVICGDEMTDHPQKVGYTQRQCAQSCCVLQRPNHGRQKTLVRDYQCLIAVVFGVLVRFWWEHRISNTEVRQRVSGPGSMSITEQLYIHRLWGVGQVSLICRIKKRLRVAL